MINERGMASRFFEWRHWSVLVKFAVESEQGLNSITLRITILTECWFPNVSEMIIVPV